VTLVLTHTVLIQTVVYAMRPALSYAVLDAGASATLLGVLSAAFALPALLGALPIGHFIDRVGEKPVLIAGPAFLTAACALVLAAPAQLVVLFVATILLGLGHLMSALSEQTTVANTTKRTNLDSMFGLLSFMVSLGQSIGPLLLLLPGMSTTSPPVPSIALACTGIGVLAVVAATMTPRVERVARQSDRRMTHSVGTALRTPHLLRALVTTAIVTSSIDIFLTFIPALGVEYGYSTAIVSAMLLARSVASMASRLLLGILVRLVGRVRLLIGTLALSVLFLACLAIPLPPILLIVLSALWGFVIGTCQPVTMAWATGVAPPRQRGLIVSLRVASNRVGQTALPALAGLLAGASGIAGVLLATGAALAVATWTSSAIAAVEDEPAAPETGPTPEPEL
jgi:MFS family permease